MTRRQTGTGGLSQSNRAVAEQLAAALEAGELSGQDFCGSDNVPITWLPVQSTVFSSAAHSASDSMLYLRFHTGDVYCYFEFPTEQYEEFLAADSKGRYFAHNIRNRFRYSQIHQPCHLGRLTEKCDC